MSDGRDIFYAGAGILWGVITCWRAIVIWRYDAKGSTPIALDLPYLKKSHVPFICVGSGTLSLLCLAYLYSHVHR